MSENKKPFDGMPPVNGKPPKEGIPPIDKKNMKKPGPPGFKGSLEPLKRVLGLILKEYRGACIAVVVSIVITAVATLAMSLFMRSLIDVYILPMVGSAAADYSPLARQLLKLGALLAAGVFCTWAYNRIMVNISQGTLQRLRLQLFERMESLPIKYFDTHPHGDIMSVYTNDVDTLRQMISQSLPQAFNSLMTMAATLISMIFLDIPLTLVSVAMVGVMMFVTSKLSMLSGRYFMEQQQDLGAVNGYIEEMMNGQKVVKVFCHEEESLENFRAMNTKLRESAMKANAIANLGMPVNANLANISYVLVAVIGAVLALNGFTGLTIGTLVAFLNLNKSFSQPVAMISQQLSSIVMASAGAGRIFGMMDEEPETDEGYVELVRADIDEDGNITETEERTGTWAWKHPHSSDGSVTYRKLEGRIDLEDVSFGYRDDVMVLHDINLFAKPGQKIAFVGGTGAGKTTIINLINRFYDVQEGRVLFDNIDVKKIKKSDLRRSLGIVLQDTHLFTETVMENIRYGRLDATDEECIEAAKLANADDFIRRLPDGYDTMLTGDGENLSQGQRQLLSIARAAVANPPALILDEATSSIDTRTEQLVQKGMDSLMNDRTSFVIAHRLSTIKNSDCIMVMEQGRIIERGTHEELLEKKGKYYQLYTGKTS